MRRIGCGLSLAGGRGAWDRASSYFCVACLLQVASSDGINKLIIDALSCIHSIGFS
jgi:hypothetical protein